MTKTQITDFSKLNNFGHFSSERDMKNFIIDNKEVFCKEVLGVDYKDHDVEVKFPSVIEMYDNNISVDIVFTDSNNNSHFIELKNPKNGFNELAQGVGQCMSYYYLARIFNISLGGVYLITSKHSNIIPLIIRDNQINITYIYFDKEKWAIANI